MNTLQLVWASSYNISLIARLPRNMQACVQVMWNWESGWTFRASEWCNGPMVYELAPVF